VQQAANRAGRLQPRPGRHAPPRHGQKGRGGDGEAARQFRGRLRGHQQHPEKQANEIFDLLEKFAQYGFNKSHSAAYGVVTYQTAYLKANYPVEFMAGVLSNEISNTDKIANFVSECQRMGITILPPDVNEERERNGPFTGVDDFAGRMDSRAVNKKMLEALVKCGAFDFSGEDRAALFARLDQSLAAASSMQKDRKAGQGGLFDDFDLAPKRAVPGARRQPALAWTSTRPSTSKKNCLASTSAVTRSITTAVTIDSHEDHQDHRASTKSIPPRSRRPSSSSASSTPAR
jgi:DNA polymerase III alpha subunit